MDLGADWLGSLGKERWAAPWIVSLVCWVYFTDVTTGIKAKSDR
jgi:hypothetical protein